MRATTGILAGTFMLAACGGDSGPTPSKQLSQAQAGVVGAVAVSQVSALVSGLSHFASPGVGGLGSGFFSRNAAGRRPILARLGPAHPAFAKGLAAFSRGGSCDPAVTDTTDTDLDGIEDNATYTFTAANCSVVDDTTGLGLDIRGRITIQDTDGGATLFGYLVTFTEFRITFSDLSGQVPDVSVGFNGTYGADVQLGVASASQNTRTSARVGSRRVFGDESVWTISFTPAGGQIDPSGGQLQAGGIAIGGSYEWSGDFAGAGGFWRFTLDTPAPLAYDGSCDDEEWPFESGTLVAGLTGQQNAGFTVNYAGCGLPGSVTAYLNTP